MCERHVEAWKQTTWRCHSDMGIPAFLGIPIPKRFGHPQWGMPKTLIASTLPKLFQTGEKSGLSISNLRLNIVQKKTRRH